MSPFNQSSLIYVYTNTNYILYLPLTFFITMFVFPVDGDWSHWSKWATCNVTCGGGTTIRTRYCTEGLFGGSNCTGPSEMYKDCNIHECPSMFIFHYRLYEYILILK